MSLAMYAAPFNDDSNNNNNDDIIHKKRTHNKTQKKFQSEGFDSEKVNSVLEKIHSEKNVDEENEMGDFNPPPKPESAGAQRRIATEEMETMLNSKNKNMSVVLGNAPSPNTDNSNLDLNNYTKNYGDERSNKEYYKRMLGNYLQMSQEQQSQYQNNINRRYYPQQTNNYSLTNDVNNDILMQKLNYMINLLEEQQDERTNNVTEEVILYSFLGIFIIFIADSFAKVGKYVR
jgi:hypothetical protein